MERREGSDAWYAPTCDEVACVKCGFVTTADRASEMEGCPRCGHGKNDGGEACAMAGVQERML
jgi:predicted Zn-ribbon and HTH transcriptional regulator